MRCVLAEDECSFNQKVAFGTHSGGLLTNIWMERRRRNRRGKRHFLIQLAVKAERERVNDERSQQVVVINTFQRGRNSLAAIPFLRFPVTIKCESSEITLGSLLLGFYLPSCVEV